MDFCLIAGNTQVVEGSLQFFNSAPKAKQHIFLEVGEVLKQNKKMLVKQSQNIIWYTAAMYCTLPNVIHSNSPF